MTDEHAVESAELAEFRQEVRAWIAQNKPAEPDFVLPQSFLEVTSKQQFEFLLAWQQKVYAAGYIGYDTPKEYGGQGIDPTRQAIITQELGDAGTPFFVNTIGLQWAGPTILAFGTQQQKKRLLPGLLSGDEIWCQGFSEPEAGSDLASLQTRAETTGEGFAVTGHKVWTTLARFAKWMILLARTDPSASKYSGISYFLFPMGGEGIAIEPLIKMTGEGGFNQVIFDRAPMPRESLLGNLGDGWKLAVATLMFERGAAQGSDRNRANEDVHAFQQVATLARQTRRDGHAAIDDPVLADELTQLWIDVEAIRLSAMRGSVPGLLGDRPMALATMHKLIFSEFHQRLARTACQLLGPQLAMWQGDAHAPDNGLWPRAMLNSYGFTIGGGTSEVQRNILGERVLGLPKSSDIKKSK